jgi:hypothetical protein
MSRRSNVHAVVPCGCVRLDLAVDCDRGGAWPRDRASHSEALLVPEWQRTTEDAETTEGGGGTGRWCLTRGAKGPCVWAHLLRGPVRQLPCFPVHPSRPTPWPRSSPPCCCSSFYCPRAACHPTSWRRTWPRTPPCRTGTPHPKRVGPSARWDRAATRPTRWLAPVTRRSWCCSATPRPARGRPCRRARVSCSATLVPAPPREVARTPRLRARGRSPEPGAARGAC